jgi:hypothetical protein
MIQIVIDEDLIAYTNGISQLEVKPGNILSILRQLFNTFPQLYVYMMDTHSEGAKRTALILNDVELLETGDAKKDLVSGDSLALLQLVPYGEAMEAASFAMTALNMSFEAAMMVYEVVNVLEYALLILKIGMAIMSMAGSMHSAIDSPDVLAGVDNSPTYSFTGITNTTAGGTPIPVTYGEHRAGGFIINMYTRSVGNKDNYLYMQLGMCEGEVEAIHSTEFNKLPSNYYSSVELQNRYGTETQEIMAEFDRTISTFPNYRKITNGDGGTGGGAGTNYTISTTPEYGYVGPRPYDSGPTKSMVYRGLYKVIADPSYN